MSHYSIAAHNYSAHAYQFCLYVGGTRVNTPAGAIPLAWNVSYFPKATNSGPGMTISNWTVDYGFSILMKEGGHNYVAIQSIDKLTLGIACNVTYNVAAKGYIISLSHNPGAPGVLRFYTDGTIPPSHSSDISLGVNMSGKPIAALDPNYFGPNLTIDFSINPTYLVSAAVDLLQGSIISTTTMVSEPLAVPFYAGATTATVSLLPDNRWVFGNPEAPLFSHHASLSDQTSSPEQQIL